MKHVIQMNVYNVWNFFSYRSAGVVVRLSAITYDRLWPKLKLHIVQYKSGGRGHCSVTLVPHTP